MIGRINIIKMFILPKANNTELEKIFQKFIWNQKLPQIASAILETRTKLEGSQYLISNYTKRPL